MTIAPGTPVFADDGGTGTATTFSTSLTVGATDSIAVFVTSGNTTGAAGGTLPTTITVSDGTNTYTEPDAILTDATDEQVTACYYVQTPGAATYTITATFKVSGTATAMTGKGISAVAVTGGALSAILIAHGPGQFQAAPTTGANLVTSGTAQFPFEYPGMALAFSMNSAGSATPAAGTGYTSIGTGWNFGGGTALARMTWLRFTAQTAQQAKFTAGNNSQHMTMLLVFAESGALQEFVQHVDSLPPRPAESRVPEAKPARNQEFFGAPKASNTRPYFAHVEETATHPPEIANRLESAAPVGARITASLKTFFQADPAPLPQPVVPPAAASEIAAPPWGARYQALKTFFDAPNAASKQAEPPPSPSNAEAIGAIIAAPATPPPTIYGLRQPISLYQSPSPIPAVVGAQPVQGIELGSQLSEFVDFSPSTAPAEPTPSRLESTAPVGSHFTFAPTKFVQWVNDPPRQPDAISRLDSAAPPFGARYQALKTFFQAEAPPFSQPADARQLDSASPPFGVRFQKLGTFFDVESTPNQPPDARQLESASPPFGPRYQALKEFVDGSSSQPSPPPAPPPAPPPPAGVDVVGARISSTLRTAFDFAPIPPQPTDKAVHQAPEVASPPFGPRYQQLKTFFDTPASPPPSDPKGKVDAVAPVGARMVPTIASFFDFAPSPLQPTDRAVHAAPELASPPFGPRYQSLKTFLQIDPVPSQPADARQLESAAPPFGPRYQALKKYVDGSSSATAQPAAPPPPVGTDPVGTRVTVTLRTVFDFAPVPLQPTDRAVHPAPDLSAPPFGPRYQQLKTFFDSQEAPRQRAEGRTAPETAGPVGAPVGTHAPAEFTSWSVEPQRGQASDRPAAIVADSGWSFSPLAFRSTFSGWVVATSTETRIERREQDQDWFLTNHPPPPPSGFVQWSVEPPPTWRQPEARLYTPDLFGDAAAPLPVIQGLPKVTATLVPRPPVE